MQANFAIWLGDMIKAHCTWALDQAESLIKIASYDVRIFWCNVKIFWYS